MSGSGGERWLGIVDAATANPSMDDEAEAASQLELGDSDNGDMEVRRRDLC